MSIQAWIKRYIKNEPLNFEVFLQFYRVSNGKKYVETITKEIVATQIFAELDSKFITSGVYKKIAVRSYSHIRAKYGVPAKRK